MAVLNPYNYAKPKGAAVLRKTTLNPRNSTNKQDLSSNNANQYLEQKVLSASSEELTLMLYEGAIKFINQAILFNDEGLIEKTSNAILRAEAIYSELQSTLDKEYEISGNLDQLYDYVLYRLAEANIEKSNDILKEVLVMSEEFRDTWKQAMEIAKSDSGE